MSKEDIFGSTKRRQSKEDVDLTDEGLFSFSNRSSLYRDQLHAKRQKVYNELVATKAELKP